MPSALASQLAASASLNASLLDAHTNKRRRTESYLFTGRDADVHDLDSIHALASNAFAQLSSLSPAFTARTIKLASDGSSLSVDFDQTLFSEAARNVDRTMQSREVNANLDRTLNAFLSLLGPWLMEVPTSKVLEWLVRRFRINEFNVDAVLSLFFPYHESPHFVKMLSILHISSSSIFSFLLPFKSAATPLARSSMVKAMVGNQAVARFIASLLPTAMRGSCSHRTLVAFNAATMHDYIASSPALDEGILAFLLSALLAPFQASHSDANATLGSYVLLSTLSHKVSLSSAAVAAIIGAMATSAAPKGKRDTSDKRSSEQFIKVAIAVCSPQEEVEAFHASTGNLCLKIPTFADELQSTVQFVGAEKFVLPLLECLKPRLEEPAVSSLYTAVLSAKGAPLRLLERLVSSLIRLILAGDDEESVAPSTINAARALLSLVHQRHVEILRDAVGEIIGDGESEHEGDDQRTKNKERKKKADELMISFSVSHPWAQSVDVNEIVVASTSSTKEERVGAVERLYKILQGERSPEASDMASIQSALLARVYDTHAGVLHTLYSSPEIFLSTVTSSITPQKLLDTIVSQIAPDPPARAVLIAHVAFLAGHFSKTYPELSQAVQERVLFPYLLASKSKFRTARGVWKALKEDGGTTTGWLRGCVDIWEGADLLLGKKDEENEEADVDVEKICQANLDVAAKIAENILASNDNSSDISLILSKLHDPLPHGRALAYLVVRVLLLSTSCEQQIDIALQALAAMKLHSVDGFSDLADSSANLQEVLNDGMLGMKVATKPGGRITMMFLQASILALIPAVRLVDTRTPTWITTSSLSDLLSDSEKKSTEDRYVALMQNLYAVAVASGSATPSQLSTHLIQALFLNLKDTSLMFLLSVLLAQSPPLERVRTRALLHALAFLRGHNSDNAVDFQTVLPSFIAVLMDARTDKQGRVLIFECISVLASTSERKHVYGLDTIYGAESTHLQYLDAKELEAYLKALLESRNLLAQDGNYINVFHQQHFAAASAKYRRRVICYLLSHAVTHPVPEARISIMSSVEDVSDTAKSHMVISAMETLAKDSAPTSKSFGINFHRYTALVASTFLSVPVGDLNAGPENSVWEIFGLALQTYFKPNAIAAVRKLFSDALEERLFAHLDMTRQAQICDILLSAGSLGNEVYACVKELLSNLLQDVHLINHLLVVYQPAGAQSDTPASKRAKLDNPSHGNVEEKMSIFTFLAEILGTKELPGSFDLLTQLLDTLGKIIHYDSPIPSDTSYPCQMLMAAVEQAASKITEPPARPIRLDILVEIIRVSENPQTFNQALLLMAGLARLAPDSVLHNIMPIFTFMGTNVFHRDDSYSFKVVQNTIENIVPVMVSSLKSRHPPGLELYIGAREFLRIFTDASNHIPRHRRQNFFIHLADVLGPQEFLAPVCMSLVDKVANRVSRQHEDEASTSLGLPISLLRHFPRELQLHVLKEVLREAKRLIHNIAFSNEAGATFLDYVLDDEHSARSSSIIKRRAQALIMFVGHAITPASSTDISRGDNATTDLVSLLVDLATIEGDSNVSDIVSVTQQTTSKVMNAIGAADFLNGALVMLQSDETRIKAGALEILADRIPKVAEAVRREQQKTATSIFDCIRDVPTVSRSIGSSICPGEESALVSTVTSVIKTIKTRASLQTAIAVLPFSLGPRLIPYFREIAQECTSVLQEGLSGKMVQSSVDDAISTLQGLVSTLPAFYGAAELRDIVKLHLDYSVTLSGPMTGFMKAIAKKIPCNMLLPVLCDLWPNLEKSQKKEHVDGLIAFFVFFKRSLRVARRPDIQEHIRSIFSVFIDGFGVNMKSTTGSSDGEPHIISAFLELVVKLNETAFRPLFRRLYDWAFAAENANIDRKVTFCHMYSALLDYFKGLINPYMSTLLQALCDILESLAARSIQNPLLWLSTVETLTKSFENDDAVFWRDDKLASVAKPLIAQVSSCIRLNIADGKQALTKCLIAMTSVAVDDSLLKSINLNLLMHSRAEDARERIFALSCSEALWREQGGKLIGFVAETATFISECAEDENDSVVRETHRLKNAVENVAGSISGL
ncbi:hypothetical protein P692DRAFT_20824545 [Suillus brevipes Sb2]|nr:hypothetical protein P692DRAFT_20824545 [Suillus brevipes Sb2]